MKKKCKTGGELAYQAGGVLDDLLRVKPVYSESTSVREIPIDQMVYDMFSARAKHANARDALISHPDYDPELGKFYQRVKHGTALKEPANKQMSKVPRYHEKQTGGEIDAAQVSFFDKEKLKAVQLDLKNRNLYKGKIDGIYGPLTQQAIEAYNSSATRFAPRGVLPEFTVVSAKKGSRNAESLANIKSIEDTTDKSFLELWRETNKPLIKGKYFDPTDLGDRSNFKHSTNSIEIGLGKYPNIVDVTYNPDYAGKVTNLPKGAGLFTFYLKPGGRQNARELSAELSHAKQLVDKGAIEFSRHKRRSYWADPYLTDEGQLRQYENPSSLEYEAHSVIQPQIEEIARERGKRKAYKIDIEPKAYRIPTEFVNSSNAGLVKESMVEDLFPGRFQTGGDLVSQLGYRNDSPFKSAPQLTINSPNISMEDVSIPLLGISNQTGETKLMKPNKNYKFKGTSSVTEVPTYQAGGDIRINPKNKGKFTASAKRAHMGVQEFASHVLANKEDYSSTQVKRANFARNASKWNHQMGGEMAFNSGGTLDDILGAVQGVGNFLGPVGSAASALVPLIGSLFSKGDKNVVSASPGMYQTGGDMALSSNSMQVNGNPNVTDSEEYTYGNQRVRLDHDEVVKQGEDSNFVFSQVLKVPGTKRSFAEIAKSYELGTKKGEKQLQRNPYDSIAQNTINHSNKNLADLAGKQELFATAMGLRDTPSQAYQAGGTMATPLRPPRASDFYWDEASRKYLPKNTPLDLNAFYADYPHLAPKDLDPLATSMALNFEPLGERVTSPLASPLYARGVQSLTAQGPGPTNEFLTNLGQSANDSINYTPNAQSSAKTRTPFTFGDTLQTISALSKFGFLIGGPEKERVQSNTTPITQEVFDPTNALYQNQRSYTNTLNRLTSIPSINTSRALANSLYASNLNQQNNVLSQYEARNAAARQQYQQRVGARRAENIGYRRYADDINAQNRGMYLNTVQNAFDTLSTLGQNFNQKSQSNAALAMLGETYKDVFNRYMMRLNSQNIFPTNGN